MEKQKFVVFNWKDNQKILYNDTNKIAYFFDKETIDIFKQLNENIFACFLDNYKSISKYDIYNPKNIIYWIQILFNQDDYDEIIDMRYDFDKVESRNRDLIFFLDSAKNYFLSDAYELKTIKDIIEEWNNEKE